MPAPPLAALFWFYKQADVCADHLALFRRHNEGLTVYGLFGGPPAEAGAFEATLGRLGTGRDRAMGHVGARFVARPISRDAARADGAAAPATPGRSARGRLVLDKRPPRRLPAVQAASARKPRL